MIRFYSPAETLGGGVILDSSPRKHRKNDKKALAAFAIKENGTQKELLELSCLEHSGNFYSLNELAKRSLLDGSRIKHLAQKLCEEKNLSASRSRFIFIRKSLLFTGGGYWIF